MTINVDETASDSLALVVEVLSEQGSSQNTKNIKSENELQHEQWQKLLGRQTPQFANEVFQSALQK